MRTKLRVLALVIGTVVGGATTVAIGYFRLDVDGIVALPAAFVAAAAGTSLVAVRVTRSDEG